MQLVVKPINDIYAVHREFKLFQVTSFFFTLFRYS